MTSEQIYRILLKAYPARYRREYEEAMAQCFRDQLRAANTRGKRVRLWLSIVADFAVTIPARHLESVARRSRHGTLADYSKPARHAIFFARQEAASFGGPEINLEHLLLGTLRGDYRLAATILGRDGLNGLVRAIETQQANPRRLPAYKQHHRLSIVQNSENIPLSLECKKALANAWEQAHIAGTQLSPRHLLAAILHQETTPAARLLRERAIDLSFLT